MIATIEKREMPLGSEYHRQWYLGNVEWAEYVGPYTRGWMGGTEPAFLTIRYASGKTDQLRGEVASAMWAVLAAGEGT